MLAATGGAPRSAAIDGLRAIAALSVFLTHVAQYSGFTGASPLGPVAARLNLGVAIFFLLSGFLLYRPWVQARLDGTPAPRLGGYALRRAVRILPAFWVALTVLAIALPQFVERVYGSEWWAYYGMLQAYRLEWTFSGLSVAWSLSTEAAFYVLLPALAWLVGRRLGGRSPHRQVSYELWGLAASVLLSLVLRRVASDVGGLSVYPNTVMGRWPWFASGLAVAVAVAAWGKVNSPQRPLPLRLATEHPWVLVTTALGLLAFSAYGPLLPRNAFALTRGQTDIELVFFALIGLCLLLPAAFGGQSGRRGPAALLGRRSMVWLGTVSYGLFLWHLPITRWVISWTPTGSFPVILAVSFTLSIGCAALSWYLVERPLMRLVVGGRRQRRRPDRPSGPTAAVLEPAP